MLWLPDPQVQPEWGAELNSGAPLSQELRAAFALNEGTGNLVGDARGRFQGTVNGNPVWQPAPGYPGAGLLLDGSGDYVSLGNCFRFATGEEFSLSFWTRPTTHADKVLLYCGPFGSYGCYLQANWNGGTNNLGFVTNSAGSGYGTGTVNGVFLNGNLYRIGISHRAGTVRIYLNDQEAAYSATASHQIAASSDSLDIGRYSGAPGSFDYPGWIGGPFLVYGRALGPEEHAQLYWQPYAPWQRTTRRYYSLSSGGGGAPVALSGTLAGGGGVGGTPTVTRPLTGAVAGSGSVSGSPQVSRPLSGSTAGAGAVSGTPTVQRPLSGTLSGAGSTSATAEIRRLLSGLLTGQGSLSGELAGAAIHLSGILGGAGGVSGSPTVARALSGTIAGAGSVSGSPTVTRPLSGTINGSSALSGEPAVERLLAGILAGAGAVSGSLTITTPTPASGGWWSKRWWSGRWWSGRWWAPPTEPTPPAEEPEVPTCYGGSVAFTTRYGGTVAWLERHGGTADWAVRYGGTVEGCGDG